MTRRLTFLTVWSSSVVPSLLAMSTRPPPWQLQRLDHWMIRCHNFHQMYDFYTNIIGCTVDQPQDLERFGGALTHLRAGENSMIDLLSYDPNHLSEEGKQAVQKMHSGGLGLDGHDITKVEFSAATSTLDHFCLRCEPFDEAAILLFFQENKIKVIGRGQRKGADGIGPSIYVQDPEGNVVELKGPPGQASIEEETK